QIQGPHDIGHVLLGQGRMQPEVASQDLQLARQRQDLFLLYTFSKGHKAKRSTSPQSLGRHLYKVLYRVDSPDGAGVADETAAAKLGIAAVEPGPGLLAGYPLKKGDIAAVGNDADAVRIIATRGHSISHARREGHHRVSVAVGEAFEPARSCDGQGIA